MTTTYATEAWTSTATPATSQTRHDSYLLSEQPEARWSSQPLVAKFNSSADATDFQKVLSKLELLLDLPPNWDTYRSKQIARTSFETTLALLFNIANSAARPPSVVPMSDGGLQLEWHTSKADLELTVSPTGDVEVFLDMQDGETWEGRLADSRDRLERFLGYVSRTA